MAKADLEDMKAIADGMTLPERGYILDAITEIKGARAREQTRAQVSANLPPELLEQLEGEKRRVEQSFDILQALLKNAVEEWREDCLHLVSNTAQALVQSTAVLAERLARHDSLKRVMASLDGADRHYTVLLNYQTEECWEEIESKRSAEEVAVEKWADAGYPEDDPPTVAEYVRVGTRQVDTEDP